MGNIEFERIWEDDDFFEIKCRANSDTVCVMMDTYVDDRLIDKLASELERFVHQKTQGFIWETSGRGSDSTPDFMMKVFYRDRSRHIGIEVFCEIDDGGPLETHHCCFYIDGIEASQLEQFGNRIRALKVRGIGTKVGII